MSPEYMDGWHDGANDRHFGCDAMKGGPGGDYERGYKDGRDAYDAAKKAEEERQGG